MVDSRIDDITNHGAVYPFDKVEGYSMKQIEDALVGAFTWEQGKTNILTNYENEYGSFNTTELASSKKLNTDETKFSEAKIHHANLLSASPSEFI